jgi:hypothetical protein
MLVIAAKKGEAQEMNAEPVVRNFQAAIIKVASERLGRELTQCEREFITSRGSLIALEVIMDTVKDGNRDDVERYLNTEEG